jgi:hypothetical protein
MKSLDPFTPLMGVSPLDPLITTLPSSWRMGFAIVLLSLVGLYYLFLVVRAFPWPLTRPDASTAPKEQCQHQEKRRKRRPRRRRRFQRQ